MSGPLHCRTLRASIHALHSTLHSPLATLSSPVISHASLLVVPPQERAYKSAFEEPARFYYDAKGDGGGRDHVNVHGTNWYAVALHEGLGISVPLVPEEEDVHFMAVAAYWDGLRPSAWELFKQREHFGKEFEGIAELRANASRHFSRSVGGGVFESRPPRNLRDKIKSDANARESNRAISNQRSPPKGRGT